MTAMTRLRLPIIVATDVRVEQVFITRAATSSVSFDLSSKAFRGRSPDDGDARTTMVTAPDSRLLLVVG